MSSPCSLSKWHLEEGADVVETELAFSVKSVLMSDKEAQQENKDGMDGTTGQIGHLQSMDDSRPEGRTLDVRTP